MKPNLIKQNKLIIEWFNNVLNGKQNDEILFLEEGYDSTIESVHQLFKNKDDAENNNYVLTNKNDYIIKSHTYTGSKNIILYPSLEDRDLSKHSGFQKLINQKLLLVPKDNDFYTKTEQYIKMNNNGNDLKTVIAKEERFLYYIEKLDPIDLIRDTNEEYIDFFIKNSINQYSVLWENRNILNFLIDKINYRKESFDNSLISDISNLKNLQILTSRLAVIIYRIATLNLDATVTEAGRYFNQNLGISSKVYNYNLIIKYKRSNNLVTDNNLKDKNFKAYDLAINESEITIRKEIAENLVNLNKCSLDAETIAKVTKLPIKEIEKLIN